MNRMENLQRLLAPRHIVFIGGSNLEVPINNCKRIGFEGEIWVVNPKADSIAGYPCYKSLAELPGAPDAAFVAVRADISIEVVAQLNAIGCSGVVCYAAGFAEAGAAGGELQQRLVQAAGNMALVGPNCYGVLNFSKGVALWPDRFGGERQARGVAIISQSGNIALNLTMQDRSLPISHVISVGNQAALEIHDYIEPLLADESVSAIGFYIEGLKDVAAFSRAAAKALEKGIPLVVLKAGTSEIGNQLALSHTSSLAGSDDMYNAMFERLGVVRVHTLSELIETLKLATISPLPTGNRVGVLTCSGGDSAMLADLLEAQGMAMPPLAPEQEAALADWLPDFASRSNPLDYNTSIWGNHTACRAVFASMMVGDIDTSLLVLDFPLAGTGDDNAWQVTADAMITARASHPGTAAVISNLPELLPAPVRQRLVEAGITPLQGFRDGVAALAHLVRFSRRRQYVLEQGLLEHLPLRQTGDKPQSSIMRDEYQSKQRLAAFGLPIPAGRLVSLDEVQEASRLVGFPLVIKGVSDQLAHKTEAGAVVLNIRDTGQARITAKHMQQTLTAQGLQDIHYLLEPMIEDAVGELIIGLKRDDQFGLALIVGTGGILVNLLNDSTTLLLPTTPHDVRQAISSLKGYKLLQGFRGKPEGDVEAVITAIMAVAEFAMEHWNRVTELDINPLMVRPKGKGVIAVDALIREAEQRVL